MREPKCDTCGIWSDMLFRASGGKITCARHVPADALPADVREARAVYLHNIVNAPGPHRIVFDLPAIVVEPAPRPAPNPDDVRNAAIEAAAALEYMLARHDIGEPVHIADARGAVAKFVAAMDAEADWLASIQRPVVAPAAAVWSEEYLPDGGTRERTPRKGGEIVAIETHHPALAQEAE